MRKTFTCALAVASVASVSLKDDNNAVEYTLGKNKTWQEAEDECKGTPGGHLASVTSEADHVAAKAAASGHDTDVWLGGNDNKAEGTFVWTDGSPWGFNKWNAGEPNNVNDEDCVVMEPSGGWNDLGCGNKRSYLCQRPNPNYKAPSEKLYKLGTDKSWNDARADCQQWGEGGDLASVNTAVDHETFKGMMDGKDAWLGGRDNKEEGKFEWTDGTPWGFTKWNEGEPNDAGASGEDCVVMETSGGWNDLGCDAKRSYICSKSNPDFVDNTAGTTSTTTDSTSTTTESSTGGTETSTDTHTHSTTGGKPYW